MGKAFRAHDGVRLRCIIIDTSSIIFGFSRGFDVFNAAEESLPGYTMVVSNGVLRELDSIGRSKRKSAKYAIVGRREAKKRCSVDEDNDEVDSWILFKAGKSGCTVCTNDMELKRKLKENGAQVVSMGANGELR